MRSRSLLWVASAVGASIGCLQVSVPSDHDGQDAGESGVLDAGVLDAGVLDAGVALDAGPKPPTCAYPTGQLGFAAGQVFPDYLLGIGFVNFDGGRDFTSDDAGVGAAADVLLQMHCSGARYALIDISTVWCPLSQGLAYELPRTYVPGWLAEGGLVLSILEQGPSEIGDAGVPAATEQDLIQWAQRYQTNYSLVNDPSESLDRAAGIQAWPAMIIVDLSTMQVVTSWYGSADSFLKAYSQVLAGTLDGG